MVLPRRAPAAAAAAAGLLMLVLGVARTGAVQVGGYLSEADIQRFGAIGKAGVPGTDGSPEDVYYGAKLLAALGLKAPGVCAAAQALVSGRAGDAAAVGFGLGALKEGGCAAELAAAGESEAVVSALKRAWQTETFSGKRLALLGELALGGGGKALQSVDAAMKQLNKHRSEEGLVQEALVEAGAGGAGSTDGTFALLETIALGKISSKGIRKTLEKALLLLPGGAVDAGASDASLLGALDGALKALGAEQAPAASVAALELGDEQVAVLARKLLRMKGVASPKAAYKALAGLQLLQALPNAPLAVVVATPVVSPGEVFKVEVRTLLGQPPAGSTAVVVESLQLPGKGHGLDVFADQALKATGSGVFEGQSEGLAPGLYELVLAVGGAGGVRRSLIVKTAGAVEGVEVTVAGKTHKGALPAAGGAQAVALEGDGVRVAFTLASPAPAQQAFLRFTQLGVAKPVETLYAAKRTERGGGDGWDYSAGVVLADEMAAFGYASGDYELSLLVGDVSLAQPLEVALGKAALAFPAKPKEHFPLYTRPLLWDSDNAVAPLPEIHHQFRQPERRPNPAVPAAFTALVLAALVFFALYLPRVGANLEAFPTGAGSAWAAAFMACLGGFVLLFAAYWLKLKAVDTLRYLLGLALVTLFVGHHAFNKQAASSSA